MQASDIEHSLHEAWRTVSRRPSFTDETLNSEWNIAHHYANALADLLPRELSFDLDVIKPTFGNKRPDIIFHIPGTNASNFLVVELKRDASSRKVVQEMERIRTNWINGLGYEFGAVVNVIDGNLPSARIHLIQHN